MKNVILVSFILVFNISAFAQWDISQSPVQITTTSKVGVGTSLLNIGYTGVNDLVVGDATYSHGLVVNANSNNDGILAFASNYSMVSRFIYNNPTGTLNYFKTGAGNLFTVLNDGKFGIGTSTPKEKFQIGNNGFAFHDGGHKLLIFNPDTNNSSAIRYDVNNQRISFENKINGVSKTNLLISSTGRVGIGTTGPKEVLDINGNLNMRIGEGFKILGDTQYFGANLDAIIFQMEDSNANNGNTDGGFVFRGHTPTDGVSKEWMVIKNGGNVGIGTTDPKEKLSVNGTIHTKEVRVDLDGWSDFVFYDNYELPTLIEVEAHIKEKGHLKDIPSAKEVTENGIFLGDMNAKLLQKIEELTLYTIEQEKKITTQTNEITELKSLKNNMLDLKSRLEKLENLNKKS